MFRAQRRSPGRPSRPTGPADPPRERRAAPARLHRVDGADLVAQERRFRALIEHSSDGIVLVARDGGLLYASPSTTRILGYGVTDLVGRDGLELAHPDDHDSVTRRWGELLQRPGQTLSGTCRLRHADGSWRWIEYVASNLLDERAVQAIVGNCRDITERRAAEEALRAAYDQLDVRERARTAALKAVNEMLEAEVGERRRSEEQLRKLSRAIEQTADSVLVTDRDGIIEYVNRSFEELTGFSRDEALGARPAIVKSGAHDQDFYDTLWRTILSGRSFRAVFTNKTRDGRPERIVRQSVS